MVQQWPKDRYGWIGIFTRMSAGLGFVALISLWTTGDMDAGGDFLMSGMMLPTFVIVLVLIGKHFLTILTSVVLDFIVNMRAVRQYKKAGKLA